MDSNAVHGEISSVGVDGGLTFYTPQVYLIASPVLHWAAIWELLESENLGEWERGEEPVDDAELLTEFMGRLCYGSFGAKQGRKDTASYLANILVSGHGSVLEHANFSFVVTRCTRGYTHQQVRHRAGWAYSQESTHFIRYGKDARICLPGLEGVAEVEQAEQAARDAVEAYGQLYSALEREFLGAKKKGLCSASRALLPNAVESKIGITCNARALRHFLELRGAVDNVVEIRMVASQMLALVRPITPLFFADFTESTGYDGWPVLECKFHKV